MVARLLALGGGEEREDGEGGLDDGGNGDAIIVEMVEAGADCSCECVRGNPSTSICKDSPSLVTPLNGSLSSSRQCMNRPCSQGGWPPSMNSLAYSYGVCFFMVVKRGRLRSGRCLRNALGAP